VAYDALDVLDVFAKRHFYGGDDGVNVGDLKDSTIRKRTLRYDDPRTKSTVACSSTTDSHYSAGHP